MDEVLNHDTVKYQLNVRSPLKALITGAVIGAAAGSVLRALYKGQASNLTGLVDNKSFWITLVSSVLVGAVLVIAFARKKDAQPFISIEDFWGGFFIGFVAGYTGESIIDLTMPGSTGGGGASGETGAVG